MKLKAISITGLTVTLVWHCLAEEPANGKPKGDQTTIARPTGKLDGINRENYAKKAEFPLLKDHADLAKPEAENQWKTYKESMHWIASKRGNDPADSDLRRVVEALRYKPSMPATATTPAKPAERDYGFQKVEVNGHAMEIWRPENLDKYINDTPDGMAAAIALGKAFFWDVQFSSDQKVSCATCHYAAGADHRTRHSVTLPALFGVSAPLPDPEQSADSANYMHRTLDLSSSDLVGRRKEDRNGGPGVHDPALPADLRVREVIGSRGVPSRQLLSMGNDGTENNEPPSYGQDELKVPGMEEIMIRLRLLQEEQRQVTARNAGTVLNAVFNHRQFHDGRASSVFNGRNNFGLEDPISLLRVENRKFKRVNLKENEFANWRLNYASLASQAVMPLINDKEMSWRGRELHHIARRMLGRVILEGQTIHEDDSALKNQRGKKYEELIEAAFLKTWWDKDTEKKLKLPTPGFQGSTEEPTKLTNLPFAEVPDALTAEYSLMEANFGLFWGIAIMLYESTLISDDTPFDRWHRAQRDPAFAQGKKRVDDFSPAAVRGMHLFRENGCADCHAGSEFTAASLRSVLGGPDGEEGDILPPAVLSQLGRQAEELLICPEDKPVGVECMNAAGVMLGIYDGGFYNVGVSRWEVTGPVPPGSQTFPGRFHPQDFLPGASTASRLEDPGAGSLNGSQSRMRAWLAEAGGHPQFAKLVQLLPAPADSRMVQISQIVPALEKEENKKRRIEQEQTQAKKDFRAKRGASSALGYTQMAIQQEAAMPQDTSPRNVTYVVRADGSHGYEYTTYKDSATGHIFRSASGAPSDYPGHSLARRWQKANRSRLAKDNRITETRVFDEGTFKAPGLRNIELTGPYMHNGSILTLEGVLEFYNRGGDYNHRVKSDADDWQTGDAHPEMAPLGLSQEEIADIVAFLRALTDDRVRMSRAPFDHPSLPLPVGFERGSKTEKEIILPAVGAGGVITGQESFEDKLRAGRDY